MREASGKIYLLTRTNVDKYPYHQRFDTKPSQQDLFDMLFEYYDEETSHRCAEELFNTGYTGVDDMAGTEFQLSEL